MQGFCAFFLHMSKKNSNFAPQNTNHPFKSKSMNNVFKGVALFIGGALVGATAALLLSPKSGEEIRQQLADYADEAKKKVQDYCEQLKSDLANANAAQPAQEPAKKEA